jgi:hypothetical protein
MGYHPVVCRRSEGLEFEFGQVALHVNVRQKPHGLYLVCKWFPNVPPLPAETCNFCGVDNHIVTCSREGQDSVQGRTLGRDAAAVEVADLHGGRYA